MIDLLKALLLNIGTLFLRNLRPCRALLLSRKGQNWTFWLRMGLLSALCVAVGLAGLPADWLSVHCGPPLPGVYGPFCLLCILLPPFGSYLPSGDIVDRLDYGPIPDLTPYSLSLLLLFLYNPLSPPRISGTKFSKLAMGSFIPICPS